MVIEGVEGRREIGSAGRQDLDAVTRRQVDLTGGIAGFDDRPGRERPDALDAFQVPAGQPMDAGQVELFAEAPEQDAADHSRQVETDQAFELIHGGFPPPGGGKMSPELGRENDAAEDFPVRR